jgi:hypothetical protein
MRRAPTDGRHIGIPAGRAASPTSTVTHGQTYPARLQASNVHPKFALVGQTGFGYQWVVASDRIAEWWEKLTEMEKRAVLRHRVSTPMTPWLVRSLQKADVPGLVEERHAPDIVPPCFLMPAAVADYIDGCRQASGPTPVFPHTNRRQAD